MARVVGAHTLVTVTQRGCHFLIGCPALALAGRGERHAQAVRGYLAGRNDALLFQTADEVADLLPHLLLVAPGRPVVLDSDEGGRPGEAIEERLQLRNDRQPVLFLVVLLVIHAEALPVDRVVLIIRPLHAGNALDTVADVACQHHRDLQLERRATEDGIPLLGTPFSVLIGVRLVLALNSDRRVGGHPGALYGEL